MYSSKLKSKIARFLAMQSNHMEEIRNNIPAGPEFFHFFKGDVELDWYQFWDQIAEHRPSDISLQTNLFHIKFDDGSLKWVVLQSEKSHKKIAELIVEHLNTYEIRAQSIRNWVRWEV